VSGFIDPQQKVLWHMEHLAALKATGRTPAPVNVEIDLSNRCSLGCEWCHFAYTHTRGPLAGTQPRPDGTIPGGDLMALELAERIVADLAGAGVKSVTWTGGGEPTLHPSFDRIVAAAAAEGLQQGLYTHGGHIGPERAALLKRTHIWVYVSLDEATAAAYQRSKGVDRFAAACAGVRVLVAAEGPATVGVGFLLHERNCDEIPSMVALGRALGADYVQFRPTIRYEALAPGQRAEEPAWVARALRWLKGYAGNPFVIADLSRFGMYGGWQGHGYTTCYWAALQTVVTPNGKVWTCCNKREHADALLGDLSVEPFEAVWARREPAAVTPSCRLMCRGHLANVTLNALLAEPAHANFV
jgi:MoaA/NifB/PqqE/SkfB family radical SAM enzyme